ncbi:MAG: 30S ribosomal protein S4 [Alphaproteobacteria bacterium]|nr:30S ribosomal protein S4 [Alphaproteobacteria bacterium]MBQ8660494.1 30S ribosomal protein S4 [Alphaproteobacteria bacterium]
MSKRLETKHKLDRRYGVNTWGRAKSPVNKRKYKPGQHGPVAHSKRTDYGTQLSAKQLLKGYYGNISEKKFRSYYDEAMRRTGDTASEIIAQLESRLDAIVYRANFVPTVFAARQVVSHGHILVNGKRVNIPSYQVKVGDVVTLKESARNIPMVVQAKNNKEREVPDYVSVNDKYEATFVRIPTLEEVPYPVKMEPNLVVEFYSRQ